MVVSATHIVAVVVDLIRVLGGGGGSQAEASLEPKATDALDRMRK